MGELIIVRVDELEVGDLADFFAIDYDVWLMNDSAPALSANDDDFTEVVAVQFRENYGPDFTTEYPVVITDDAGRRRTLLSSTMVQVIR